MGSSKVVGWRLSVLRAVIPLIQVDMTRSPNGGVYLGAWQRLLKRPLVFFILVIVALSLTACSGQLTNESYAGMSSDGPNVYLAYGPQVLSFNADTQTANWLYPPEADAGVLFFSAPNVEDDQVVFGDYGRSGGFFSPQVTVSVYALPESANGSITANWTNSEAAHDKIVAPALQVEDTVYVGTADNDLLALDRASGEQKWRFETGHAIWGQPTYADGVLYVASMDWSLYALDADSGELIWQQELGGALPSKPALDDNTLYISSFDRSVYALNRANGEIRWQVPAEGVVWGSPTVVDDVVYFGDIVGNIYKVDAASGEIVWSITSDTTIQASPVLVDDRLFVASAINGDEPTGALTAYSAEDGTQLWRIPTLVPLFTTPVVVNNDTIVVAQQNADALLIGFDTTNGTERWSFAAPTSS